MKKHIGFFLGLSVLLGLTPEKLEEKLRQIDFSAKEPPMPKGCKQYFFDEMGNYSTEKMALDQVYFKCIALNDKSAKKKFDKYKAKNQ